MNGSAIPVTGMMPIFIPMFTMMWLIKNIATPRPNRISKFDEPYVLIFRIRQMTTAKHAIKMTQPISPHSSANAAKIKSVLYSG